MPTTDQEAPQARGVRKSVDWEAVELRYRTGTESLRTIAADFTITEGAIRQKAKKEGWARDLTARVKQATEQALLRKAAATQAATQPEKVRSERQAIAVEAEMRSDVILRHRGDIRRLRDLLATMLGEVELAGIRPEDLQLAVEGLRSGTPIADLPEPQRQAIAAIEKARASMDDRIDSAKRLTDMLEKLVRMERVAFGMVETEGAAPANPLADLLAELGKRRSALPVVEEA